MRRSEFHPRPTSSQREQWKRETHLQGFGKGKQYQNTISIATKPTLKPCHDSLLLVPLSGGPASGRVSPKRTLPTYLTQLRKQSLTRRSSRKKGRPRKAANTRNTDRDREINSRGVGDTGVVFSVAPNLPCAAGASGPRPGLVFRTDICVYCCTLA